MSENIYVSSPVKAKTLGKTLPQQKQIQLGRVATSSYKIRLSRFEIGTLIMSFLVTFLLVGAIFMTQMANYRLKNATETYQNQTVELQQQTDLLLNYLSDQYNYKQIKAEAEAEGMEIRPGSVREIVNE